jgi:hypothetical protein
MLFGMKSIAWLPLVIGMMVSSGCAAPQESGRRANDFLGASAASILASPTRIEGWNFQRPDGSVMADASPQPLDLSIARELSKVLRSDQTYRLPARAGAFEHSVAFRIWSGTEALDVVLSFGNDQLEVKYPAADGPSTSSFAGFTAAREPMAQVAHKAFPAFNAPKEK